ncbi:hypothetical protein [Maioricimonas sp. JC845]|uniref:hypothetical protein n=1 Tax=Maioricimonas sp. JC845 TaxID=3232138 RepID=UPI0034599B24
MADDLDDVIQENAEGPAEARGDSGSVRQHSLKDQIEADRYLAAKRAARAKRLGLRLSKLVPPGSD